MAGRRCPGTRCPVILTNGERYCPTHAREYEQRRGTRQARGYDADHDKLKAAWQRRIDAGAHITCATCPVVITGRAWDLGHNPARTAYIGPQCVPCNRADGGRQAHR